MNTPAIIAVISSINTNHHVQTPRHPDAGECLIAPDLFIRPGGKGANTCVAAARLSRKNPVKKKTTELETTTLLRLPTTTTTTTTQATTTITTIANENPHGEGSNTRDVNSEDTARSGFGGPITAQKDVPVQVRMIGAVGHDDQRGGMDSRGTWIVNELQKNQVDISGVRTAVGHQTGRSTGFVITETEENRLFITPGANSSLRPQDFLQLENLAGGHTPDLVVCNLVIPRETTEQILETAHTNKISTLLNPSPAAYLLRPVYRMVTHLILNETEAAMMSDVPIEELNTLEGCARATEQFLNMGVQNVVITLGARGAYYNNKVIGQGSLVEGERDVKVVDPSAAGDTFTGAYAVQYVRQKRLGLWDIRKAVEYGCKASARTVEGIGALESIPWSDELERPTPAPTRSPSPLPDLIERRNPENQLS